MITETDYESKFHLQEKHKQLAEIICHFDRVCRDNKIEYSLSDGTLLGAVRHGGPIPWDDDADIMMTREEYNKLLGLRGYEADLQIIKTTFCDRITIRENNPDIAYVDLFVLDRCPESRLAYIRKSILSRILRCYYINGKQIKAALETKSYAKLAAVACLWCVGRIENLLFRKHSLVRLHDRIVATDKSRASTMYLRLTDSIAMMGDRYPEEWFGSYSDTEFSGYSFKIISRAEDYLKGMYGDYMQLPSEEKRVPENHLPLKADAEAYRYSITIKDFSKGD